MKWIMFLVTNIADWIEDIFGVEEGWPILLAGFVTTVLGIIVIQALLVGRARKRGLLPPINPDDYR